MLYNDYIKALKNCQTFADLEKIKARYPEESQGSDMRIISDIHICILRGIFKCLESHYTARIKPTLAR